MARPSIIDSHPRFVRAYEYWLGKSPNGALPGRQHINPLEIPDLLPFINLVDVLRGRDGLRFRFRLVGTAQDNSNKKSITGQFVDQVCLPTRISEIVDLMKEVVESREPKGGSTTLAFEARDHNRYLRVHFPLAGDGKTIDMLMTVHVHEKPLGQSSR